MLFVNNVEALTQDESSGYVRCYDYITSDASDTVMYCGTCSVIPGRWRGGMSYCNK